MTKVRDLLLDLDGTLLGLDIDRFVPVYLERLAAYVKEAVRLPDFTTRFAAAVQRIITPREDMRATNEQAFYNAFREGLGPEESAACDQAFLAFYRDVFPGLRRHTRTIPGARRFVEAALRRGYRLTLATQPVFPRFVIDERLRWAGISPQAFSLITSFESMHHIKPEARYFEEVLKLLVSDADRALMIGNDRHEDGAATLAGMRFAWVDGAYRRSRQPIGRPVWRGTMLALGRALEGGSPPFVD